MKGYKLAWGIWDFDHSITSRDTGISEVHETKDEISKVLRDKQINYASMGYELWFSNITEIEIHLCKCGKYRESHRCWYCGDEELVSN